MRKAPFFLVFIIATLNTLAQNSADTLAYIKAADGSEYKIYATKGTQLVSGNFMEISVTAKYKDSLLFSTYEEAMPQYGLYDTANFPVPFKDAFKTICIGDSIVLRTPTDSLITKGQAAPFIHSGEFIYQYYRITNLYTTKAQVDSAQQTHVEVAKAIATKKQQVQMAQMLIDNKEQIAKDSKTIETYLAKNNLKAIKAKMGTYIVVKKQGTGKKISATDIASVNYTGRAFSTNKVFDSNTDPKFKHIEPLAVDMSHVGSVVLGWTDALAEMQKGTKATVYIPSSLAWGNQSPMPDIKADEIVVFDMDVVSVRGEGSAPEQVTAPEKATAPVKKVQPAKTKPVVKAKPKTTIKKAGQ